MDFNFIIKKKKNMKKIIVILVIVAGAFPMLLMNSCAPSKLVSEKSGAQLWGENCNRCHNAPSMDQYSKDQWTVIGAHMRVRANLTTAEINKVVGFLQGQQ
jgi:hypothetical protein